MSQCKLGSTVIEGGVDFQVWAPNINKAELLIYDKAGANIKKTVDLTFLGSDCWGAVVTGQGIGEGTIYNYRFDGWERQDPRAREVRGGDDGLSVVRSVKYPWECDNFQMPGWDELVIYQMHARTYPDRTPSEVNQLDDVASELWYLARLGVNAIQLLPTTEFPGDRSWGYNPGNIFAIESSYGGPMALKKLVDAAHKLGIAVFLDVVYNHFGPHCGNRGLWQFTPWFGHYWVEGEHSDEMGGVYFYNDWRAKTPFGGKSRPDFGRQAVRDFIHDNAMMWLEEYRIDGLRFDSVGNIRNVYDNDNDSARDLPEGWMLMQWINRDINAKGRRQLTIAEDLKDNSWITRSAFAGGAGFGSQWQSSYCERMRGVLAQADDRDRSMSTVRDLLCSRYETDACKRVIYLESHDVVAERQDGSRGLRLPNLIEYANVDNGWFAKKRSALGAVALFTSPGIPMVFQGQELLEWRCFGDDPVTHGVDWKRFCTKTTPCEQCQTCAPNGDFHGFFRLYQDLIHLRRNWFDNTRGLRGQNINVFHCNEDAKVVAYHRWEAGGPRDDVVVVLNFSNQTFSDYCLGFPRGGGWKVRFNSDWNGYEMFFHNTFSYDTVANDCMRDGMPYSGNVALGPYTGIILSQD